ncbi:MAG TPA: hypothetical protein VFQ61_35175 [Polyangiaceae bacterium]|nr:hypothetical protein [Polyangiaceae bacterium]
MTFRGSKLELVRDGSAGYGLAFQFEPNTGLGDHFAQHNRSEALRPEWPFAPRQTAQIWLRASTREVLE